MIEMPFWSKSETDPVCGMKVVKKNAAATLKHMDKTLYFCSSRCETSFAKKPRKYLKGQQTVGAGGGGSCH